MCTWYYCNQAFHQQSSVFRMLAKYLKIFDQKSDRNQNQEHRRMHVLMNYGDYKP